ncbi:MAG: hypothetical protein K8R57_01495 [Verrucomicrobia bacterium]|nr:hypothetical protein [Verrucomicrobiota bacterium]
MKKIILSFVALILLILIGGVGYIYFSLNTLVKKAVETVGPTITKTHVGLASANLSPFSGSGRLSGFVIGNPEGFQGPYALKLGSIAVSVDKSTILKDTIVVNSIIIRNPAVALIGTPFGNNLGKLLQNIKSGSSSKSKEENSSSSGASKKFIVKEVVISGAKVDVAASALDQKIQQTLPIPDITLRNIGSDGSGVSARDVAMQIITPLLNAAAKEGINTLSKQGLRQLQQKGAQELGKDLNKALPGLFK